MALVIIGGGVIGLSVAYYTSKAQPGREIIVIDSEDALLRSASGFSGGYIVRDWFHPSVLPLAELSYVLHRDLANTNDGKRLWGYTESTSFSASMEDKITGKVIRGEDWLLHGTSRADVARLYANGPISDNVGIVDDLLRADGSPKWANLPKGWQFERISSIDGCAQIEPREMCEWLLNRIKEEGVQIRLSTKVTGLWRNTQGAIAGLHAVNTGTNETSAGPMVIQCKDIVLSTGCWTPQVYQTLLGTKMSPGIKPLPGYSIVVRSPRYSRSILHQCQDAKVSDMSHAVFFPPGPSWTYSPECMARLTRSGKPEIYVAGLNDESIKLPDLAGESTQLMTQKARDHLKRTAVALTGLEREGSEVVDDCEVVREGLCFRPVSTSGLPIIDRVKGWKLAGGGGIFVASGHGPWGITLSLATGMVVSELLQGKQPTADISRLALHGLPQQLRSHL